MLAPRWEDPALLFGQGLCQGWKRTSCGLEEIFMQVCVEQRCEWLCPVSVADEFIKYLRVL